MSCTDMVIVEKEDPVVDPLSMHDNDDDVASQEIGKILKFNLKFDLLVQNVIE